MDAPSVTAAYQHLHPRLVGYASRFVGTVDAEDVASEAWLQFLEHQYASTRVLWAITRNLAHHWLRWQRRDREKKRLLQAGEQIQGHIVALRRCRICGTVTKRADLCEMHYYRLRRGMDVNAPRRRPYTERAVADARTVAEVRRRLAAGEKGAALARELNLSTATVSRIRTGTYRTPRK